MRELNRLFFALWPDEATRLAAHEAAKQLKVRNTPSGYLSAPARYHVTLLFLGDFVPAEQERAACMAASKVKCPPFALQLDQAGSFRNKQVPWWLGPKATPPELTQLYQSLHEAMVAAQVPPERMKFVPHLTILRDAGRALPSAPIKPIVWNVQDFVLVRSRLDLKPVQYEILGRWRLIPGAQPAPEAPQMTLF